MNKYKVDITGMSPMIMHHNNLVARDAIAAKGRKGGKPGDDRFPADNWKAGLYLDDKHVVVPVENILGALLKAGSAISIGKMKTLKAASQAIFFSSPFATLLVHGKPIPRVDIEAIDGTFVEHVEAAKALGFELLVKPVTVGTASHVRVRPMFRDWAMKLEFETDDADLLGGDERIEDLWVGSGRKGIGDWRPSSPKKPGPYGVYSAKVTKLKS